MNFSVSFVGRLRCSPLLSQLRAARSVRTKSAPKSKTTTRPIAKRFAKTVKPQSVPMTSVAVTAPVPKQNNSDESFESLLKRHKATDAFKKILQTIDQHAKRGELNQTRAVLAMKTMVSMRMQEDLPFLVDCFLNSNTAFGSSLADLNSTVSMVRFCCIQKSMSAAEKLTNRLGFVMSEDTNKKVELSLSTETFPMFNKLFSDLSLGYISSGMPDKASACLRSMKQYSMQMEKDTARKVLKEYTNHTNTQHIRRCLSHLIDLTDGLDDPDCIQIINNVFIRTIDFVKGAVSMDTLPPIAGGEVAFIGRSNVGKSSLINTICNRGQNNVAYTSKKPGKTAEFNYFDAKGVVGPNREPHQFYLVDLPGVGYAQKSRALRDNWTNLLRDYVHHRSTLRVIFHLVDSRHGIMESDEECLSLLETLPTHVLYVIVLTKVDKQRGADKTFAVQENVIERIYSEIGKRTRRVVPILFTSSVSKLGVASLWSTLLDGIHKIFPKIKSE